MATSLLQVKALENSSARFYTLSIFANITIPTQSKVASIGSIREIKNNSLNENRIENLNLAIEVKQPLTWIEIISDYWNKLGAPITFIYGIIAIGLPWILNEIRKKLKKNKYKKLDGWT
jgi:hypothetical protein